MFVLLSAAILGGHVCACIWIFMGTLDNGWLKVLQNTIPDAGSEDWRFYSASEIYWFALYWIFTVFTTVGYGDYAGGNNQEYLFTIMLEFFGLLFFALLTGLITPLVQPEPNFEAFIT